MKPKLFSTLDLLKQPVKGDFYAKCSVGHSSHARITTNVGLAERGLFYHQFKMMVYDWRQYFKKEGDNETVPEYEQYCTGQDIISYCIDRQGVWEKIETALVLDILSRPPALGQVLDFGSHIGWYSMLAAIKGYTVAALDGSAENLSLLRDSAEANGLGDKVYTYLCWLDADAPVLNPKTEQVRLLKADVEGAEVFAYGMCRELFNARKIDYAILEISPVFNLSYPQLVEDIAAAGYDVYVIPSNLDAPELADFSSRPLETVIKHCELPAEGRRGYVAGLHQENFLFRRQP